MPLTRARAQVASYYPDLVQPPFPFVSSVANAVRSANTMYICRYVMPRSGLLRDVSVFIQTQSGNLAVGLYDCGEANNTLFTRTYDSGSVAMAAAGAWQVVADPQVAVKIGQQLFIGIQIDNATASVLNASALGSAGADKLPTNFLPYFTNPLPVVCATQAQGGFTRPASFTQSALTSQTGAICALARIS